MPSLEFQGSQGLGPRAGFDGVVKTRDFKSEGVRRCGLSGSLKKSLKASSSKPSREKLKTWPRMEDKK